MGTISNIIKMSKDNPFSDIKMMKWVQGCSPFKLTAGLAMVTVSPLFDTHNANKSMQPAL